MRNEAPGTRRSAEHSCLAQPHPASRLIPCLPAGLSHTPWSSFLPKGLASHLATQTLVIAINNLLWAATPRCSGMNSLLGTRAWKSRGLFTHRGAGVGP